MSLRVSPGSPLELPPLPRSPASSATLRDQGFVHCRQRHLSWCWAACIAGVDSISGRGKIRQVWEVVEDVLGVSGCEMAPPRCTKALTAAGMKQAWKEASYRGRPLPRPLTFREIRSEIGQKRAVQAFLKTEAHYVLLIGWLSDSWSEEMIDVSDPARSKPKLMAYSRLTSAYKGGWNTSFLEIELLPGGRP